MDSCYDKIERKLKKTQKLFLALNANKKELTSAKRESENAFDNKKESHWNFFAKRMDCSLKEIKESLVALRADRKLPNYSAIQKRG